MSTGLRPKIGGIFLSLKWDSGRGTVRVSHKKKWTYQEDYKENNCNVRAVFRMRGWPP